jgi:hypothetical protein
MYTCCRCHGIWRSADHGNINCGMRIRLKAHLPCIRWSCKIQSETRRRHNGRYWWPRTPTWWSWFRRPCRWRGKKHLNYRRHGRLRNMLIFRNTMSLTLRGWHDLSTNPGLQHNILE